MPGEIPGPGEEVVGARNQSEPVSDSAVVPVPDSPAAGETSDAAAASAPSDAEQVILNQIAEAQANINRLEAERDGLAPGDAKIPSLSKTIAQEAKALAQVKRAAEMEEVALVHAPRRAEKKAIKEEEDKDKTFRQVGFLIDGEERLHDHMQQHRKERVEKHYGKGWLGKINAMLAGANIEGGPSVNQDIVLRLQKTLIKEIGVKGTISLVAAGLLAGTVTAPMLAIIGTAIAAGIAGRAAVEGIRVWRGKERGQKAEIEKMDGAVEEGIQTLIHQCSALRLQLREENESTDPSYDVETDPRYLEKFFQIVELLEDDSQRRVALISSSAEDAEGKHEDRYVLVGADGKELGSENQTEYTDIKNVDEEYKAMRQSEKKAETIADVVAGVTSFAGAIWAKFGLAKIVAEHTAKATADAMAQRLASGEVIGPYDFDKIHPSHLIQKVVDGAKVCLGPDGIWRDTLANLRGAIESQELVKLVASEAKALIGVGISSLVQIFHRPIADTITQPEERIAETDKKNMAKLEEGFKHDFPSRPGGVDPRPEAPRAGDGGGPSRERPRTAELGQSDHLFTNVGMVHTITPGHYFEEVFGVDVDNYDPEMHYFYALDGSGGRIGDEPYAFDESWTDTLFKAVEPPESRFKDSLRVEGEDGPAFRVGQEISFSLEDKNGAKNPAKAKITEIEDLNNSDQLNSDDSIKVTFELIGQGDRKSLTLPRNQWAAASEGGAAWELLLNKAFKEGEASEAEDEGDDERPDDEKNFHPIDSLQTADGTINNKSTYEYTDPSGNVYDIQVGKIEANKAKGGHGDDEVHIHYWVSEGTFGDDVEVIVEDSRAAFEKQNLSNDEFMAKLVKLSKPVTAPGEPPAEPNAGTLPEAANPPEQETVETKKQRLNEYFQAHSTQLVRVDKEGNIVFRDEKAAGKFEGAKLEAKPGANTIKEVDFPAQMVGVRSKAGEDGVWEVAYNVIGKDIPGFDYGGFFHSSDPTSYNWFRNSVTKTGEGAPPFGTGKYSVRFDDGELYELTNVIKTTDDYNYRFEHKGPLGSKIMETGRTHLLVGAVDWYVKKGAAAPAPPPLLTQQEPGLEEWQPEWSTPQRTPPAESPLPPPLSTGIPAPEAEVVSEPKSAEYRRAGDFTEPSADSAELPRNLETVQDMLSPQVLITNNDGSRTLVTGKSNEGYAAQRINPDGTTDVLSQISGESLATEMKEWSKETPESAERRWKDISEDLKEAFRQGTEWRAESAHKDERFEGVNSVTISPRDDESRIGPNISVQKDDGTLLELTYNELATNFYPSTISPPLRWSEQPKVYERWMKENITETVQGANPEYQSIENGVQFNYDNGNRIDLKPGTIIPFNLDGSEYKLKIESAELIGGGASSTDMLKVKFEGIDDPLSKPLASWRADVLVGDVFNELVKGEQNG